MRLVFMEGAEKYTKNELLEKLYAKEFEMKVHISKDSGVRVANLDLVDCDGKPDCLIGSFAQNWFVRTPKGIRCEEYGTMLGLITAITREMQKIEYKVDKLVIKNYLSGDYICEFK